MWKHFNHQADIGILGTGNTIETAFEEAAMALMAVICNPQKVSCEKQIHIRCQNDDIELLFVDFLNAIIYEIATRRMLFSRFEVMIDADAGKLKARIWGEEANPEKHETAVEVKGATYTQLSVTQDQQGKWTAKCVVDV